jgi:hypothetical protein
MVVSAIVRFMIKVCIRGIVRVIRVLVINLGLEFMLGYNTK